MRLGEFIDGNLQAILGEWEVFAQSIWPETETGPADLRDHAEEILRTVVRDMKSPQTTGERAGKSKGLRDQESSARPMTNIAALHALARAGVGFDLMAIVAEYRALRASVLRLWRESKP